MFTRKSIFCGSRRETRDFSYFDRGNFETVVRGGIRDLHGVCTIEGVPEIRPRLIPSDTLC